MYITGQSASNIGGNYIRIYIDQGLEAAILTDEIIERF